MYWSSTDYEKIAKMVIDIYLDYEIKEFPVDEKKICKKLGIKLLPYSEFPAFVLNKSKDAFYLPMCIELPPIILYNDEITNKGRRRFTIFHDLKHFVSNDKDENQYDENMADYFARYFMCPTPLLIHRKVENIATIMADYNVSFSVASNVLNNLTRRRKIYGDKIFDYEQPLIDLIEGSDEN